MTEVTLVISRVAKHKTGPLDESFPTTEVHSFMVPDDNVEILLSGMRRASADYRELV